MTTKLLANQYRGILSDPVEGFTVELADESSLFEWKVYIEGPKDTCYEGGVFQLRLSFPKDYPMSPPTLRFVSDFWHPNVYNDGKVCMSILHPPGEDAMSGELAQERWLPTQSVTTIVLSLISILNDPNFSSPANVDASVEWRKNKESYLNKCKKLVEKANREKPPHVEIPHPDTNEAEHAKIVRKWKEMNTDMDAEDFYEHNEEHEDSDSDENEDEFLESNEESDNSENIDSGDEVEEDKHKKVKEILKDGAEKEDKGKTPEIVLEVSKSESSTPKTGSTPDLSISTDAGSSKPADAVPASTTTTTSTSSVAEMPLASEKAGPSSAPNPNPPVPSIAIRSDDVIRAESSANASSSSVDNSGTSGNKKKSTSKSPRNKKKGPKCIVM